MTASTETAHLDYGFDLENERIREDGDKLVISGLASNFDLDRQGDVMARTAFDRALKKYLTENPVLLYNHKYSMPMGKVTEAYIDSKGLWIAAELPRPEPGTEAMNIWKLIKARVIRALSVGAVFTRKIIGGVQTIVDADLREVSIASVGAVPSALFSVQAGKAFGDPVDPIEAAQQAADLLDVQTALLRCEIARLS